MVSENKCTSHSFVSATLVSLWPEQLRYVTKLPQLTRLTAAKRKADLEVKLLIFHLAG